MTDNDTVIVVGVTRIDEYGNLWVTPQGGGDEVKIAKKREKLHPLFQQGVAVLCHWETYMNKPYISDAKLVEGELPPPVTPETVPVPGVKTTAPQERGMWWKQLGDDLRSGHIDKSTTMGKAWRLFYFAEMTRVLEFNYREDKAP